MEYKTKKILILFSHPNPSHSSVNLSMLKSLQSVENVTVVDLYADYPDFHISREKELKRLHEHDIVIFQFPLSWFYMPSILKEWQDVVLNMNTNSGNNYLGFEEMEFFCSITIDLQRYHSGRLFKNTLKIKNILTPLEMMCDCIGMKYLPPYVLELPAMTNLNRDEFYINLKKEEMLDHVSGYKCLIEAFSQEKVDMNLLSQLDKITSKSVSLIVKDLKQ